MAAETENTCIAETMKFQQQLIFDHAELDKSVGKWTSDCDNDGQTEMTRLALKNVYCHF